MSLKQYGISHRIPDCKQYVWGGGGQNEEQMGNRFTTISFYKAFLIRVLFELNGFLICLVCKPVTPIYTSSLTMQPSSLRSNIKIFHTSTYNKQ